MNSTVKTLNRKQAVRTWTATVVLFLATIVFVGCGQNASQLSVEAAHAVADKLTYIKDSRTSVCYAIVASRGDVEAHQNGLTITYVPCTPEVEEQIRKDASR